MEYYISIQNEKRGPYSIEELRTRGIGTETLVSTDGTQWTPAWQIDELRELFNANKNGSVDADTSKTANEGETVPPEMADYRSAEQADHRYSPIAVEPIKPEKKRSNFGGCILGLLIVAIVGATMVFTCPNEQAHKAKLSELVNNSMDEVMERNSPSDGDLLVKGLQMVGGLLFNKVADAAIDNMVSVDNYFVCSLGRVHYDSKDHIVSLGLLGHIFTINQEDMTKAVEKYYLDFQSKAETKVKDEIKENVVDPMKNAIKDALGGIIGEITGSSDDDAGTDNDNITDNYGNGDNDSEE